jgi:hypothetical protein
MIRRSSLSMKREMLPLAMLRLTAQSKAVFMSESSFYVNLLTEYVRQTACSHLEKIKYKRYCAILHHAQIQLVFPLIGKRDTSVIGSTAYQS